MMAGQLLSPNNSMKMKAINAVRRIKFGSPKIREVLRQRCRQQIHERRDELLRKRRLGLTNCSDEVKETLSDIVHQEFDNIAAMEWTQSPKNSQAVVELGFPLDQDEALAIEEESLEIDELIEEQWILEEYQNMLWEQMQISSMFADDVICPICLKCSLQEIPNFVVCNCGLRLPVQNGLQGLKQNIQDQVNAHSAVCLDVPKFSIFQDGDGIALCFSCMSCDIFAFV